MKRITSFFTLVILIIVVFIGGALATQSGLLNGLLGSQTPRTDVTVVLNQIQLVSELTTTRYETSGSVVIERDMPALIRALYGDRLTLFGAGTVTAGIDLAELNAERVTRTESGGITINLPYPQLLDCILREGETKVLAREASLFTSEDRNFETLARRTLIIYFRNTALENGVYELAKQQAESVVRAFIGAVEPDVALTITYDDPPAQAIIPASCRDGSAPVATPSAAP